VLTARPLSIWDAGFCWRLAHDPDVRDSAIDRTPPTVLGHLLWVARWLFKGDRQAWVITGLIKLPSRCNGGPIVAATGELILWPTRVPVGLARVQSDGTVSIEVMPAHRGKGVGLFGVQVATEFAEARGWATPVAHIRADNKPSIGLFAKAGYEMTGANYNMVTMRRRAA
jgi:GNAT superfamily N-acetyltransferase